MLNDALLISMHLQADVCGALIGSFLAFFLTPNPALHNNSIENQTLRFFSSYIGWIFVFWLGYCVSPPTMILFK